MKMGLILLIVLGVLLVASIILAILVTKELNSDKNIELLGGQLENSDSLISDAIPFLKITNEWNR